MTKFALLSDIHGNSLALSAVLADIAAQGGVDKTLILGDLVAIGPDPVGVMRQLDQLPNTQTIRGNTDRYSFLGDLPFPDEEDVQKDWSQLKLHVQIARSFAWTQGAITMYNPSWFDWFSALPVELRLTLPDGTRLLGVHASPGTDDGKGIRPGYTPAEWDELLADCEADLLCVGHTHWVMDEQIAGIHVVNLGSVSNPLMPDRRASYVILQADENGYTIQHRRVDYDHSAVIAQAEKLRHPSADYIRALLSGEIRPAWYKE